MADESTEAVKDNTMKQAAYYRKPIAGFLTGVVALAVAFGFDIPLDAEMISAIALVLANLVVIIVPNKQPEN